MAAEAIRAMLCAPDPATVQQAAELLRAANDPALLDAATHNIHWALDPPWRQRVCLLLTGHFPTLQPQLLPITVVALEQDDFDHFWCLSGPALKLKGLHLRGPAPHIDLSQLPAVPQLDLLQLSGLSSLRSLDALPPLPTLRTLRVQGCSQLVHIRTLSVTPALRHLTVQRCPSLQQLGDLQAVPALRNMQIIGCPRLAQLDGLGGHPALRMLAAYDLPLAGAALRLPALRHLRLGRLSGPLNLDGLAGCSELETAKAFEVDLGPLDGLRGKRLRRLELSGRLSAPLRPLADLPPVPTLTISAEAPELESLDGLGAQPHLSSLHLSRCSRLQDISALRGMAGLRSLKIEGARSLRDLSALSTLQGLEELSLSVLWPAQRGRSRPLSALGLDRLTRLRRLSIASSGLLGSLDGIEALTNLQQLSVRRCTALKGWSGLDKLPALASLDTRGCTWAGEDAQTCQGSEARDLAARLVAREPERKREIHRKNIQRGARPDQWGLSTCREMSLLQIWWLPNLSEAAGLESLSLRYSHGMAIRSLGGLPSLKSLTLDHMHAFDLTGLARVAPSLERLVLRSCHRLPTLAPLEACTRLADLTIDRPFPTEPTQLAGLTALEVLRLSARPVPSLSLPPSVRHLELLRPVPHPIKHVPPWAPQIEVLTLSAGGGLRELAPLRGFSAVRELRLENTIVSTVRCLRDSFPQLQLADLRGSQLPEPLRRVWQGREIAALRAQAC